MILAGLRKGFHSKEGILSTWICQFGKRFAQCAVRLPAGSGSALRARFHAAKF
jgi:hypothetical protein